MGPEYGTVDAEHVRQAAKDASRGVGADLLLVRAFAFDASAGDTAKEFAPSADLAGRSPRRSASSGGCASCSSE